MRTTICLITALFLYISSFAQSPKKQSVSHSNIVKLGMNTFFDTDEFPFYLNWETKVGKNESVQLGVLPRVTKFNDDNTTGVGVSAAFRKYLSKNHSGISGLFISPVVKAGFLNRSNSYTSYYGGNPPQWYSTSGISKTRQYNVAVVFGQNWVYKSGFSFEVSGGFGYYHTNEKSYSSNSSSSAYSYKYKYSGILPQLQINFGYAF